MARICPSCKCNAPKEANFCPRCGTKTFDSSELLTITRPHAVEAKVRPGAAAVRVRWTRAVKPAAQFVVTAAVIIALVVFLSHVSNLASKSRPRTTFRAMPVPTPQNGTAWSYFAGTPAPTLTIDTRLTDGHHLVKLEDWASRAVVALLFVHAGSSATINIPPGTYRLKYAAGKTWYGEKLRFGPDEACEVADQQFVFFHYQQGDKVVWSTDTVTLYPRRDGNLKTTKTSPEQF